MVFGNMGDDCGTGVAFTRDPATGEKVFYGEYLINAQGEDVVAGIRTPKKIAELQKDMPAVYKQLDEIRGKLEKHYRDVQDIEFTVQKGKLWMLQTRNGKRTGFAAVRFAVDMVEEGLITKEEALSAGRIPPDDLNQLLQPIFDPDAKRKATRGSCWPRASTPAPARPPAASSSSPTTPRRGSPSTASRRARQARPQGPRHPGPPRDQPGRHPRHAGGRRHPDGLRRRLVARRPGQPADGQGLHRRLQRRCRSTTTSGTVTVGDKVLKEGDYISVDGFTGEVMAGQVATKPSEVVQVLIEQDAEAGAVEGLPAVRQADGVGRRGAQAARSAPTPTSPTRRRRRSPSAPRASACAAPSTCSSTTSSRCAR